MIRVLFVDDERNVLSALQRMLRPQRAEWDMVFVDSGEEALRRLATESFDAIVSDVRMPGIDGVQLLTRAKRDFPATVRIVLSGYTETDAALKLLPIAHRFLAKPCDAAAVREAINRLCGLQRILTDQSLRKLVSGMGSLPVAPCVSLALNTALENSLTPLVQVANLIEKDPAIAAKVLQLVNSAFFALPRRVVKVEQAVSLIGTEKLRNVVLMAEAFHGFGPEAERLGVSIDALQQHALLTASIARELASSRGAEEAFTAALLHDIGKLIFATKLPGPYAQVLAKAAAEARPAHEVELEQLAVSHAELGAYLLGVWGLPLSVVEAVAYHHHPQDVASTQFDVVAAIHFADGLARVQQPEPGESGPVEIGQVVRLDYLESLGMSDNLHMWQEIAAAKAGLEAPAEA